MTAPPMATGWQELGDFTGPAGLDGTGYATGIVPAGSTAPVVDHELDTKAVKAVVWAIQPTGRWLEVPVVCEAVTVGRVEFTFTTAPAAGEYAYLLLAGAPVSAQLVPVPPVDLADAATIVTPVLTGVHFILDVMGGPTRLLGAPGAGIRGQRVLWELTAAAACTVTLAAGAGGFQPTDTAPDAAIPVPAGRTLLLGGIWSPTRQRWTVPTASLTTA